MARLASPRRRRDLRVTAAGALLVLTILLALTAVGILVAAPATGGSWALAWMPPVLALSLSAALLLHAQLRAERLAHAADRQAQAQAFTESFVAHSAEHAAYAVRAGGLLDSLRRQVCELEGTLRLADARGDEAEIRLRDERARLFRSEIRVIELEVALERRQCDQIDELAAWPRDDVDTVVDLLNWERSGSGETTSRTA